MKNGNLLLRAEGAVVKAVDLLGSEKKQRFWGPVSAKILSRWKLKGLGCRKTAIPRGDGTSMRVCVFNGKKPGEKAVGVLWLHGGGYAIAAPETAVLSFAGRLIKNRSVVLVAPDYTLSVTKPFPAALNDAFTAYRWLLQNREALGIDYEKIVVGGESAGGGLTAALCAYARDHAAPGVGFQMPLYPMLDDRPTATSAHNTAPVWNTRSNVASWNIYLNGAAGGDGVSPYAAPARLQDLAGLPPAVTVVGTLEPFYRETLDFFARLERAGVPAALRRFPGAYHAFDMFAPYAGISRQANAFLLAQYDDYVKKYIV